MDIIIGIVGTLGYLFTGMCIATLTVGALLDNDIEVSDFWLVLIILFWPIAIYICTLKIWNKR